MKFINGSQIQTVVSSGSIRRGKRSNLISCWCYDTKTENFVFRTIDMRDRAQNERYIPEWCLRNL